MQRTAGHPRGEPPHWRSGSSSTSDARLADSDPRSRTSPTPTCASQQGFLRARCTSFGSPGQGVTEPERLVVHCGVLRLRRAGAVTAVALLISACGSYRASDQPIEGEGEIVIVCGTVEVDRTTNEELPGQTFTPCPEDE